MAALRCAYPLTRGELERRVARTDQQLNMLRAALRRASCAVSAAERAMLARRAEREEIAVRMAQLVDVRESLEATLAAECDGART